MDYKMLLSAGLVVVVLAAVLVISTRAGVMSSVASIITGETESCLDTPYDSKCECATGYRKIYVPWIGLPKWSCEKLDDLILDPDSPTFQEDALNFTLNYLEEQCGDVCTDLSCGELCVAGRPDVCNADLYMTAGWGYGSDGDRIVNIECIHVLTRDSEGRQKSGTIPWRMMFLVESDTGVPYTYEDFGVNYCVDPDATERCEPEINEIPAPTGIDIVWGTNAPIDW